MNKKTTDSYKRESVEKLVETLSNYDVISFDIFDTLILRPFEDSSDLFRLLSPYYNMVDFFAARKRAQKNSRKKMKQKCGHTEVKIQDIYEELNQQTNIPIEDGIKKEFELEKRFCYANPYMQKIYNELIRKGKTIIIVSDMYLPSEYIKDLLDNCGYKNYQKLYVSCEYCATKIKGDLFELVNQDFKNKKIIHVGDNIKSDVEMPTKYGWETYYYKKVNDFKCEVDKFSLSPTIGSIYKGIVKNSMYNGIETKLTTNQYYRYGYIYSGFLILGYVNWIHSYAKQNKIDKILFLSRDGYILKKVYDMMFLDIESEYVLWSRHATLKTSPEKDLKRFNWQFLIRPLKTADRNITVREVLEKMNLMFLKNELMTRNIRLDDIVNVKIKNTIIKLIQKNIDLMKKNNTRMKEAAKKYYYQRVAGHKNICIVDIGYRGSGGMALKDLFENEWKFECDVKTAICYGFSKKESFDDTLILNDSINTYVFSDVINTDLSKNFQKNLLLNEAVIDILIASAPKPSFLYFDLNENNDIEYFFEKEEDYKIIYTLQEGILDFVEEYLKHCHGFDMLFDIPGRDAHEPIDKLFNEENTKKFVHDFAEFPYSLLVSGVKLKEDATLLSTYLELISEQKRRKEIKRKKQIKKKKVKYKSLIFKSRFLNILSKKLKKLFKRLKKIKKNKSLQCRFYYTKYYEKYKIKENIVLLQSYGGDNFSGNVYYLLKELKNSNKYGNFNFYVGARKTATKKVRRFLKEKGYNDVKVLTLDTRKYCKILSQAKYLINNVSFPTYFIKKEGQVYINTWHGTPLKGLGKAINDAPHESGNYQRNFLMVDYFIYPNKYTYEHMIRDYMIKDLYKGESIISGYPRNSIFYDKKEREKLRERLGVKNKKVIIYMPTWRRGSNRSRENNQYEKIESLLKVLNDRLDDDTVVYIKLHNLVKDEISINNLEKIRNFPEEYETYEFLNIADCLITDYSSVLFDFANTGKKIILYAYDQYEYMNGRSVYFSLEKLPFPIVETEEALLEELKDIQEYTKYNKFKNKFCYSDCIDTTKKICEYIFLGNKQNYLPIKEKISQNNILVYTGNLNENYITENVFNILNNISTKDNNIYLNFYMKKIIKNRFFINNFSNKFNYITMQGNKNILIREGISSFLYYSLGINTKRIQKNLSNIYQREVNRLFPTIKFSVVIDASATSREVMNLYKSIEADKKYIVSFQKDFLLNKKNIYKNAVKQNIGYFNDFYIVNDVSVDKEKQNVILKCARQSKENLFEANENEIEIEL